MKTVIISLFVTIFSHAFAQMEIGSVWKAIGATAQGLENLGLDSTKIHFLSSGVFEISYIQSSTPKTETSTWHDLTSNAVTVSYDPNGTGFGMMCPTDTTTFDYSIATNVMTLSNIQGNCSEAIAILTNSQWQKVGTSTASLSDEENQFVEIVPNPANGFVTLKTNSTTISHDFTICNALGELQQLVIVESGNDGIILNVSSYPNGVYFVQFQSGLVRSLVIR
jgi:hypothetical protein